MHRKEFDIPAVSRLLTKKETATFFSVTERTVDRWLLDGTLPSDAKVQIGGAVRFRLQVLERLVDDLAK